MTEKSPPAEAEVGTLTHNLFAAGPLIEGDHQLPKMKGLAMLSRGLPSASMPNFSSVRAAKSISTGGNSVSEAHPPS